MVVIAAIVVVVAAIVVVETAEVVVVGCFCYRDFSRCDRCSCDHCSDCCCGYD